MLPTSPPPPDNAATPAKAQIVPEVGPALRCLFNPSELTVMKSTKWESESEGKNAPDLQFKTGASATLSMKLFFDTTREDRSVTKETDMLLKFMEMNSDVKGSDESRGRTRPPWVQFQWGAWKSQKVVLEKATIKYTYFKSDGTPLRATADVKFKQFQDDSQLPLQNPTSHTPYPGRIHHVTAGETLDRIAWKYFADPTKWLLIAEANAVDNPLDLQPGRVLIIPARGAVRRGY